MTDFNFLTDDPTLHDPNPISPAPPAMIPWALGQYFEGEVDLIQDLTSRYPQMPIMSLFHLRTTGARNPRNQISIATQDGAANLVVEIDVASGAVQFTFIVASLLGARFRPGKLSVLDRAAWLEPMRREAGEVAFLWNHQRWTQDYVISASSKNFTYLFAFSPSGAQAAARFTPEVNRKFLDWLSDFWG